MCIEIKPNIWFILHLVRLVALLARRFTANNKMGKFNFNFTEEEKIGQNDKEEKNNGRKKMLIAFLKFMALTVVTLVLLYVIKFNFYKNKNHDLILQDVMNNRFNS